MHIQVLKTYQNSFSHVFHHKLPWFRVAFAPALLYVIGIFSLFFSYWAAGTSAGLSDVLMGQLPNTDQAPQTGVLIGAGNLIYFITSFISTLSFLIKGYRYGVFGEGGHQWWSLPLNMRFVKMLLYIILIVILAAVYILLSVGVVFGVHYLAESITLDIILGIILGIYAVYLYFRLSLTFLLVSVDQLSPLVTSWRLLKGNVWRLFLLLLLIGFTIAIIGAIGVGVITLLGILLSMIHEILLILMATLTILFLFAIWLLYWAVFAKAFSLVYLSLKKG